MNRYENMNVYVQVLRRSDSLCEVLSVLASQPLLAQQPRRRLSPETPVSPQPHTLQTYLAHKKPNPPRALPYPYA